MCHIPGKSLRFFKGAIDSTLWKGTEKKTGWRLSELLPDTASHMLSTHTLYPCASLAAVMETSNAVALGVR